MSMQSVQLPPSLEELVERLRHVPGVVAISLGGSRARGPEKLAETVQRVRHIVGLARPRGMQADEVVQQEQ